MTPSFEIRVARASEEPGIVAFLRDHWKPRHIFVTNPEVLRWQHHHPDRADEALTFVLAARRGTGELLGLLGFVPFRRFDPSASWTELALAIWKVRDDAEAPGLGVLLLKFLIRELRPELVCAIGVSEIAMPIYRALGYTVGNATHAALFPARRYLGGRVALGVPPEAGKAIPQDPEVEMTSMRARQRMQAVAELEAVAGLGVPRKSWAYVCERYLNHPFYEYSVHAIRAAGCLRALLVWRRVESPLGAVARGVDVLGDVDVLARCGASLRDLLDEAACEYFDVVHYGVSPTILKAAGFVSTTEYPDLVLPNYFEPFEQRNVDIRVAFRATGDLAARPIRLFRADSDQDRPNDPRSLRDLRD